MADATAKLIPVARARETILEQVRPVARIIRVAVADALGAVLAESQTAPIDVPGHDNSAMDGFAVNTADLDGERPELKISQRIAAGHPGNELEAGTAARIFTGAPIPPGADAVVIQEDTRFDDGKVVILEKPRPGANIRLKGNDIAKGAEVLRAGRRLRPQDLGLLASLGISRVAVRSPLTVAVINTGDEVVPPEQELRPGQIYDSNGYTLAGLLRNLGCQTLRLGIAGDDPGETERLLAEAAGRADCIITTGGVSVGDEDHVRQAVQKLGVLTLWKLAIKPGKPFSFGRVRGVPFFGLPGNPVAVFVTFVTLVRPCLLKMAGAADLDVPAYRIRSGFAIARPGSRDEYIRVRLVSKDGGDPVLEAYPHQGSSILTSLSWADGLAVVPAGAAVKEGDLLNYLPFSSFL